jgi:hypothetical protein
MLLAAALLFCELLDELSGDDIADDAAGLGQQL